MSASPATNNSTAQTESKSAKKKQATSEASQSVDGTTPTPSNPDTESKPATNGVADDDFDEATFFRDLQKSLRNATKKLNATAKVDSIIAENPGKSLDDLVAEKKINVDQKAQALKKPTLQANVAQLEEQLAQYKKFAAHYEKRLAKQKADLENAHKEELEAVREKVAAELKESHQKNIREQLLALSKFLRAAAAMRRIGDETAPESRAFEGVLFQVYGGTYEAVDSMLKLINGAEEKVPAVEGDILDVTYAQVKQTSEQYAPAPPEGTWTQSQEAPAAESAPASDPTVANAGLTELQDTSTTAQTNGVAPSGTTQPEVTTAPSQTSVGDAANAAAETNSGTASANADEWTEVPRDPAETETGVQATPAAGQPTTTWAEDGSSTQATAANNEGNDGFEQVVHHQRQNSIRGRGGARGRGRGDSFRGRGRGDFRGRGRGRGDFRGGRGRGGFAGQQANRAEAVASQG